MGGDVGLSAEYRGAMPNIAQRLEELGITLPPVTCRRPANYIGASKVGNLLFVSGHGPTSATASTSAARSGTI